MAIDTNTLSAKYRERIVDLPGKRILITRIGGSGQERDLTKPPNADGLGRVRHFYRQTSAHWVPNPLPIDPACSRLQLSPRNSITAQVFQNAACNWRCWYCYVPFDMLSANEEKSEWSTVMALVKAYLAPPDRPPILDLSGGQPELTPEWVLWTMQALEALGESRNVYLWSDDNLSNDYFWRYLNESQRAHIRDYPNYGKVGCFKGFDEESFAFNTEAEGNLFQNQFDLFGRYIAEGIDMYAYLTITHPGLSDIRGRIRRFTDRLQQVDPMLPLRTIPLEIVAFGPLLPRLNATRQQALTIGQYEALDMWRSEVEARFSAKERATSVADIQWAAQ